MTAKEKDRDLVRRTLDEARLTLNQIAEESGIGLASARKYRNGIREMPDPARIRVSSFLMAHAKRLERLANELSATVEEGR